MRGQATLERGSTLEILSRYVMEACSAEEETIAGIEEELNIHTRRTSSRLQVLRGFWGSFQGSFQGSFLGFPEVFVLESRVSA